MRPLIGRLAATILMVLLAGPGGLAWRAAPAGGPDGHGAQKAGMSAPLGATAAAAFSAVPPAGPAPLLASASVVAVSLVLSWSRPPDRVVSPPRAMRSAPTILRI